MVINLEKKFECLKAEWEKMFKADVEKNWWEFVCAIWDVVNMARKSGDEVLVVRTIKQLFGVELYEKAIFLNDLAKVIDELSVDSELVLGDELDDGEISFPEYDGRGKGSYKSCYEAAQEVCVVKGWDKPEETWRK